MILPVGANREAAEREEAPKVATTRFAQDRASPAPLQLVQHATPDMLPPPRADTLPPPRPVAPSPAVELPLTPPTIEGAALLGLARVAVQRGEYAEAVRRFTEYLKLAPGDTAVQRELAGILVRAGDRQRAIEEYRRLLATAPDDVPTLLALADLYITTREYREAIALLSPALERTPNNAEMIVRLARVFAFERNFLHAQQLFERALVNLPPDDERLPRDLPKLLLDLQRPSEALLYLLKMREHRPNDPSILADLIRAYAGIGDTALALKTVDELARNEKAESSDRIELADTLLQSGHDVVAATVYGQVLIKEPGSVLAQVGLARVAVYQHQPQQACKLLDGIKPSEAQRRRYQLAWGEYFQLVGEYIEGLEVYRELICRDPLDGEAILARAKLLQFIHEYEKAKAEYAKVPPDGSYARQARQGCASTLFDQRRFGESIESCEKLLGEMPADGDAAALLIRNLVKTGDCPRAESFGRGFLAAFGRIEPAAVPVQLALGRALLDSGKFAEAAHEFECLLARPAGRTVDAWYGLSRALLKIAGPAKADEPLLAAFAEPGHETRNRLLLADLFYGDNDDHHAIDLALSVLKHDGKNLAALIRLADAQLREARPTAHIAEVVHTCKEILTLSPSNVRGRLTLARAYSTAADYHAAVLEYDELISRDPSFLVPRRERARILLSAHQFAACAAAYDAMLHPGPEEILSLGLQSFLQRCPQAQGTLGPLLAGGAEHALAKEVAREAEAMPDPAARACLRSLLLDAEARAAEIVFIRLESDAKSKKDWRNFTAVPIYEELTHKEADNVDAIFDLGQVFGELKQTHHALDEFSQVLAIDPEHREASIALERASLELNPRLTGLLNYFNQSGRQGLANVARLNYGPLFTCPYGEEDETITVGYSRTRFMPAGYLPLDGNWLTLGASKRCGDTVLLYGLTNVEQYANRIDTRPTFDIGANWEVCDGYKLSASGFLNNVVENGESIQQDIYRGGINVGADATINRLWHAAANYRLAYYSDVNRMNELYLVTDFTLSLPPCKLKLVFDLDYLTYSQQTVFVNNNPNFIYGALHPYFAPAGYTYYEGRIEWTQWLSRDYFVYSNQCWYSLQYALGFDDNLVPYNSVRGIFNWDPKPWLSVGLEGQAMLSSVYKMQQAMGYVVMRFPCRLW